MLQMDRDDGWTVMGVFDGHGMWGGKVASAVRDGMVRAMKDVDGRKMNGSDPEMVQMPWALLFISTIPCPALCYAYYSTVSFCILS